MKVDEFLRYNVKTFLQSSDLTSTKLVQKYDI